MDCLHCKGKLERSTTPFSIARNGYTVSWQAIPAWVCQQCGEPLFDGREVDLIQAALRDLDEQTETLHRQPVPPAA